MKAIVQRVKYADVTIDGKKVAEIGQGFLVLLGVISGDAEEDCIWLANKVAALRIFEDAEGKMNKSLKEVRGAVLVVPNFTIAGDCKKGNRPSFIQAERPEQAIPLFEKFKAVIAENDVEVQSGIFGADMKVGLLNDGPVTLIVENELTKTKEKSL